jgi:outer membrane protein TolC
MSPPSWAGEETSADAAGLAGPDGALDGARLVREVLERNPTVEAARQTWEAAAAREAQVVALDDPVLSYSLGPRTIGISGTRYGNEVSIAQRFPFPGKLGLQGETARAGADASHEDYESTRRDLALAAVVLFSQYYAVERSLETNAQHRSLVQSFKRSAEAQYVAGRASQQDPIRAEVELGHLVHARVILEADHEVVRARMNGLLHRQPGEPLPPAPSRLTTATDPLPPASRLQEIALAERPEIRAMQSRILAAEAAVSLARREYLPDFGLSASYSSMWENPRHRFMVGVSVNVPLQLRRRNAAVAEATAQRTRLERVYAGLRDDVRVEVAERRRRAVESREVVDLYRDVLLPASNDQVVAARSGLETGRVDFGSLIDAQRNLQTVELEFHEASAELHRRVAELDRAVGRIPRLSSEGALQ